jgi:hypothetical protein
MKSVVDMVKRIYCIGNDWEYDWHDGWCSFIRGNTFVYINTGNSFISIILSILFIKITGIVVV